MRCIGIIGAMEVEVASLKEQMKDIQVTRKASMEFYSGIIEGKNVVVVRSGIGKVNAAVCTQILIDDFKAEVVINTGIAGSLNADINIGDIVVSTDLIHHDMNAVAFGYPVGQIPQMEAFSFHSDDALRARLAVPRFSLPAQQHAHGRVRRLRGKPLPFSTAGTRTHPRRHRG